MHKYATTIKMHQTDAAGLLFFGAQFELFHDAYESFLAAHGLSFAVLLKTKEYFVPIVHAQGDYKAPLFVGDKVTVLIKLANVGSTSFTLDYTVQDGKNKLVGCGQTVHVAVNKATKKKILLPLDLRKFLAKLK